MIFMETTIIPLTLGELMTRHADQIRATGTLADAAKQMAESQISSIIVVEDNAAIGIITERDVLRAMRDHRSHEVSVTAIMSSPVTTLPAELDCHSAYQMAARQGIRHLVVADSEGHPIGVVTETDFRHHLGFDFFRQLRNVQGLMDRHCPALPPEANLESALAAMESNRRSCVVVVDQGKPVGIVTERDVVRLFLANTLEEQPPLGAVMTHPVLTVDQHLPLVDAAHLMQEARTRHLVVTDNQGRYAGMLSEHDLMRPLELNMPTDALLDAQSISREKRHAEHLLRQVMEAINDGIWEQDMVTNRGYVSPRTYEMLGLPPEAPILNVQDWRARTHPDDMERTTALYQACMAPDGPPYEIEYRIRRGDGGWHWLLARGQVVERDEAGRPLRRVGTFTDIHRRKEAELQLLIQHDLSEALVTGLDSDQVLAVILDAALRLPELDAGMIFRRQADGAYVLKAQRGFSAGFADSFGHLPADSATVSHIRQGKVTCSCQVDHRPCAAPDLLDAERLNQEAVCCLTLLPVLVDNQTEACLALASHSAAAISDNTLRSLETLSHLFSQTLLRLQAQEEAADERRNMSGLFNAIDDFIFVIDHAGRIIEYNTAVAEKLGYSAEQLLNKPALSLHPPAALPTAQRLLTDILAGRSSHCPLPLLRADGSILPVETRFVHGTWNGQPVLIGASRDITRQLEAESRQRLAASVFENAHEGIMITDPQGIILEVNHTFTELTGYGREEVLGQNPSLLKSGHQGPEFYADMWQSIQEEGYWRGEVWNRKKHGEVYAELLTISAVRDPAGTISHYVGIFSDITLMKENQARLERMAHFDALTQLPNRILLADRLHQARAVADRSGRLLAVCYADLDQFKPVNDEFGHAVGDQLLIDVAQRLKSCIRAGDTVARFGGDEFAILLTDLVDVAECDRAVSRIITHLAAPFRIAGRDITVSASIGVTLYPLDHDDPDTLLRHADQAMYTAKQAGRNRHYLFDPERDRRARNRRAALAEIEAALRQRQFCLYYQPIVDMRQGQVIGLEALIRWQHPERGLLLPASFLPILEDTDFAITLGDWVVAEALTQAATWYDQGLRTMVSINISGAHLLAPHFVEHLQRSLGRHPDLPPSLVELEILETTALEDINRVSAIIESCQQLGVKVALDDFGTGYASLTYFRRLPANILKIDQSFIRDMLEDAEDLAIVEGVIGLTQAFHRQAIAEGVETLDHGLLLMRLGCDVAQGFGLARPMPASEVPGWVASFRLDPMLAGSTASTWSREDLPLLLAPADHKRWLAQFAKHLDTPGSTPPHLDGRTCRFGRWNTGRGRSAYGDIPCFAHIEPLHMKVHDQGAVVSRLVQEGDAAGAREAFVALTQASDRLIAALERLQQEIQDKRQGR